MAPLTTAQKANCAWKREVLDTVSHMKAGSGRVTRAKNGYRYFVAPAHPFKGIGFRVSVECKCDWGYRIVRRFKADAIMVRGLASIEPRLSA